MATEDGGKDVPQAEKVGLKRKLTGPPRLLLGKTRTRSVGEERPEAWNKANRTDFGRNESSLKYSTAAAESDEPTEAPNMEEEVSCEDKAESSRGRCDVTGEGVDITNRKVNRRKWWRRFFPAVVCFTGQTKGKKSSAKQQSDQSAPPTLQETNAVLLNNMNTEENTKHTKGKKTTFKRFLTSSNIRRTPEPKQDEKPSLNFRKKLQMFLTRRGRSQSSLGNMEDMRVSEEAPRSSVTQVDEPTDLQSDMTERSPEVMTVTAEMNVQLSEETTSPDESPTEERRVSDTDMMEEETDAADESEIIQTDSEAVEVAANTNNVPADDLNEVDEVFCDATETVSDVDNHLSCDEVSEVPAETSEQPTTNGPAILLNSSVRIELVPPDDITEEEDEEEGECWEGNQDHLLLLLGFHHSERQLLQMARSVVRDAMNAAVDQLSREQPSVSDGVHRELQGCRDHA